ncbi:MAG TPA: sulfotransferase [Xanthomonadales bacterium]|nr:sulfotransferase [Xanthomonadales bacterium]
MLTVQSQLQLAAQHLQRGDSLACQVICSELLLQDPHLPAAYNLRGLARAQTREYPSAIEDLNRVWPAQPQNTQAALWLGRMHRLQGNYQQAVAPLRAAVAEKILEIEARYELAQVLTRLRQTEQAIEQYQLLLALQPAHGNARANLAFLLERANRLAEAQQMADQVLQAEPENFLARLTQGTLQRRKGLLQQAQQTFERILQQALSPLNHSIVLNQLGQCLLAQQQYPQAFQRFEKGNALLRSQHPHGQATDSGSYGLATIARLQNWLDQHPPASWPMQSQKMGQVQNDAQLTPVFMVGFPRSGTTLMDQALSAHPQVEVLEEHEFLDTVRRNWVDGEGLQKLPGMSQPELLAARQYYLDALTARRKSPGKPVVVDKLPLNLVYLFLIHRLFPDARILFMLRDPRDACLSCYFQSFELQGAMPYFLDLQQTADYYDAVMSLARQSLALISNPVYLQRYESLVEEFEAGMHSVVQFLGLSWNEEILHYRQKAQQKIIDTPSYQQVTQPLYREAIGRWRHFPAQVELMQPRLGRWIDHFDYPEA